MEWGVDLEEIRKRGEGFVRDLGRRKRERDG